MSLIGNTSGEDKYPAVQFKNVGDSVAGRVVAFEDYQAKDFQTKEPKFFPSGDPIMAIRITLEMTPGDPSSRVSLFAEKVNMIKAIAKAVKGTGAKDLEENGELALTHTGRDGRSLTFEAAYARPEGDVQAA